MPVIAEGRAPRSKRKARHDEDASLDTPKPFPVDATPEPPSKRLHAKPSGGLEAKEGSKERPSPNAAQLVDSFQTTSADVLRATLSRLRSFTSLSAEEASAATTTTLSQPGQSSDIISANDVRLQVVAEIVKLGGVGKARAQVEARSATAAAIVKSHLGILDAWEFADKQSIGALLPLTLFVLAQMLQLLDVHQPFHELGEYVIEQLLPTSIATVQTAPNPFWDRLQAYLGNAGTSSGVARHAKGSGGASGGTSAVSSELLTLATIRLLLQINRFARGKFSRRVLDAMSWGLRSLPRLLNMRRRAAGKKAKQAGKSDGASSAKASVTPVTLARPDVRTLWMLFLLSFLQAPTAARISALSLGRDFLPAIFKGLRQDSGDVVAHVLESLYTGLVGDAGAQKLPRNKVVGLLNEWACKQIAELYERHDTVAGVRGIGGDGDDDTDGMAVAEVAHHFLLAMCTHRGRGVCYADNGWYGRHRATAALVSESLGGTEGEEATAAEYATLATEQDAEEAALDDALSTSGGTSTAASRALAHIHNKVLFGLLRALPPSRSIQQTELIVRILEACPELLGPYLASASGLGSSTSLEPRAQSSAWLCTASFLARVLRLPLPEFRVRARGSAVLSWSPTPPPLSACLASLLPASLTTQVMGKGISHADRLVRLTTLGLVASWLGRLHRFKLVCLAAAADLGEDEESRSPNSTCSAVAPASSTGSLPSIWAGAEDAETDELEAYIVNAGVSRGQWTRLWTDVEAEARRRLPDAQLLVEQLYAASAPTPVTNEAHAQSHGEAPASSKLDPSHDFLLVEAALRVIWLCQCTLPDALGGRIDLGRLLTKDFMNPDSDSTRRKGNGAKDGADETEAPEQNAASLANVRLVCQLHTLRIVLASMQSAASGGFALDLLSRAVTSSSPRSYACLLLTVYVTTPLPVIRATCRRILAAALPASLLFQHDPSEWQAWNGALPFRYTLDASVAAAAYKSKGEDPSSATPIGESLSEEQAHVLVFIDECMQRCLKTPHRYIEMARAARQAACRDEDDTEASSRSAPRWMRIDGADSVELAASPWLMVIVEQLSVRMAKSLVDAPGEGGRGHAERGALAAFLGRLLPALVGHGRPREPLVAMVRDLERAHMDASPERDPHREQISFALSTIRHRLEALGGAKKTNLGALKGQHTNASTAKDLMDVRSLHEWIRKTPRPLDKASLNRTTRIIVTACGQDDARAAAILGELDPEGERLPLPDDVSALAAAPDAWLLLASPDDIQKKFEKFDAGLSRAAPTSVRTCAAHVFARLACSRNVQSVDERLLRSIIRQATRFPSLAIFILTHPGVLGGLKTPGESQKVLAESLSELLDDMPESGPSFSMTALFEVVMQGVGHVERTILPGFAKLLSRLVRHLGSAQQSELLDNLLLRLGSTDLVDTLDSPTAELTLSIVASWVGERDLRSDHLRAVGALLPGLLDHRSLSSSATFRADLLAVVCQILSPKYRRSLGKSAHAAISASLQTTHAWSTPGYDAALLRSLQAQTTIVQPTLARLASDQSRLRAAPRTLLYCLQQLAAAEPKPELEEDFRGTLQRLAASLSTLLYATNEAEVDPLARGCVVLAGLAPGCSISLAEQLLRDLPSENAAAFRPSLHALAEQLLVEAQDDRHSREFVQTILDRSLLWTVRRFAEDDVDSVDTIDACVSLSRLVCEVGRSPHVNVKPHLAEPVIEAGIKNRLGEPPQTGLVGALLEHAKIKSIALAQHFGRIMAHSQLRTACDPIEGAASRDIVVRTVHAALRKEPRTLCRPAFAAQLVQLYGGTLTTADRRIFESLRLYEATHGGLTMLPLLVSWRGSGASGGAVLPSSTSALEAIAALDPAMCFATCASFPRARTYRSTEAGLSKASSSGPGLAKMYDPLFVLALLTALASMAAHLSSLQWLSLLRSNALGVALCALSSRSAMVREHAFVALGSIHAMARRADFQEKNYLLLCLDAARDCLPSLQPEANGEECGEQLPALPLLTTLYLAHCLRALAAPSSFTFPLFMRFLLQRPVFDPTDIPMLYGLLFSSSDDQHRQERAWMLRFLRDCVRAGGWTEWRVMKRRHTWELLASLYEACLDGGVSASTSGSRQAAKLGTGNVGGGGGGSVQATRNAIEELLLAAAADDRIAVELCQRRGLLSWMQRQMDLERAGTTAAGAGSQTWPPRLFWIQLLDATLEAVDLGRLVRGSDGVIVGEILGLLLANTTATSASNADALERARLAARATRKLLATLAHVGAEARRASVESDEVVTLCVRLAQMMVYAAADEPSGSGRGSSGNERTAGRDRPDERRIREGLEATLDCLVLGRRIAASPVVSPPSFSSSPSPSAVVCAGRPTPTPRLDAAIETVLRCALRHGSVEANRAWLVGMGRDPGVERE